jgi:glycyl-tRNA synthetase
MVDSLEKIVSLAKRRGFVYPGSEMYGGLANSWDYGPLGVELRNNIRQLWWDFIVRRRDDVVGIEAALIMNPKVWEASGHVATFHDPLVEDKETHERFRLDHLLEAAGVNVSGMDFAQMSAKVEEMGLKSPSGNLLTEPKQFNMMLKTHLGPVSDESNAAYLRPETAQAMFVDFKSVVDTSRKKLPFGIAQIGKAFRNEITPGNFIFRTREFEQMELEYFFAPPKDETDWQEKFNYWKEQFYAWFEMIGLKRESIHELEVPVEDRAHYSKRTVDFEFDFPFGRKELYGLAYRTDFDLKSHEESSGVSTKYRDQETGEEFWPHAIEPTWGVDRTMLAVLCESYTEEADRVVLKLPAKLAPYKAAVSPLLANKPQLVEKARGVYDELRQHFMIAWDDRGNIGKRYKAQDEIGTPYCIVIDFDSLEDEAVTVRDRDTQEQQRVKISELSTFLFKKL